MRHLFFIIGLMTTASAGQDKPVKGPVLIPQTPAAKKEEGPTLPPLPAPAETKPATGTTTTNSTTTLSPVSVQADYLKDMERLQLTQYGRAILDKGKQHPAIEVRRGVLKGILKMAAGIVPYQHGRDIVFTPSKDENGLYLSIDDKTLNLNLAFAIFQINGAFKDLYVNAENMKKMTESEANPYAEWKLSPQDERLASMARKLVGHDEYPNTATLGEFEYLLRASFLGNRPDLRTRGVYSQHAPTTGQNYFYHVITLKDAQTRETRGVVGFFHNNSDNSLVDYITSVGPKAVPADVINTFNQRMNLPSQQNPQRRQTQSK